MAWCGSMVSTFASLSDDDLRTRVVMVAQENFLFSGTIADNIRFGKPDATR